MKLAVSFTLGTSPGAFRLSPSKKSPHGSTLRPFAGFPHLLGSDPRRGSLLSGYGEIGVSRFAFVGEEDCAPFDDPFAYPVPDDLVLCAVAKDAGPAKLSLPNTLASQTNLTFLIAIDGALGDALADQLAALGLKVERCTPADLAYIAAPPALDTHTAPCDYPPDEPPPPPAAVAVEVDTMKRKAADTSFDVQAFEVMFELDALLEAAQATAAAPVIDDNHTTQLDEHANPSPPAVAAPAEGGAAAVDEAAHTNTFNEAAHGEEDIDRAARAVACAATDANQNAEEEAVDDEGEDEDYTATDKEIGEALEGVSAAPATGAPVFDLSVGCGAAVPDHSPEAISRRRPHSTFAPKLKSDGREVVRGLARVRPLKLTFKQFGDLLRSHIKRKYQWKPGPFVVGATFNVSDKQPTGHRDGAHLICVSMLMLDIDDAPDFPTDHLEERLKSLGVAGVGYTTWSHGRKASDGGGKSGTCARVILPLARSLTAPADLPQRERVERIGRQLAALVGFIGECLGISLDSKALDKVSKQPEQLMYTPRLPAPGVKAWFTYQDGPALDPDNLPGGVTLAALLGAPPDQQATIPNTPTSSPSDTPRAEPTAPQSTPAQQLTHATPSPTASPKPPRTSPPAPQFSGPPADDQEKSERWVLKWAADNEVDLGPRTTAGDVIKHIPPHCPCDRKCPDGSAFFINPDGKKGFKCQHNTCPAGGNWQGLRQYIKSKTNENGAQPDTKTPPPDLDAAAPSTASDATTQPHTEAASVAPRRVPILVGNPSNGILFALPKRIDLMRCKYPDPHTRPHLASVKCVEDIDALASIIPDGKLVIIGIHPSHDLYPHALKTFRAKGCDVRHF